MVSKTAQRKSSKRSGKIDGLAEKRYYPDMSALMFIGILLSVASGLYFISLGIAKIISENIRKQLAK
jgi:hypothetical protein